MQSDPDVAVTWREALDNAEVNGLHAEGFEHPVLEVDWCTQLQNHSLGWVSARKDGKLVGFLNVAWDGNAHAFILDTLVAASIRRAGLASRLVAMAESEARAAGCEWLHVDFEDHLRAFYLDARGFQPTAAGVIRL